MSEEKIGEGGNGEAGTDVTVINIEEGGGGAVEAPPLAVAALQAMAAATKAVDPSVHVLVITYNDAGAYQYRSKQHNATFMVGLLTRVADALIRSID